MLNFDALTTLIILLLTCVDGTHFRGAMFWWTASRDDPRKVDISFRVSWRRTYRESTYCNISTISHKTLIGPPDGGDLLCVSGCYQNNVVVGDMRYYCTDYSEIENWSSGERTYTYAFPAATSYKLGWKGKGWVEGLQQGRDAPWAFAMYLNLQPRSDTRRTNSSPRTAMTTILSLKHGCNHTITIPREDPDGDAVFCRWADPLRGECGGVCSHNPGIQLNPVRCEVTFPSSTSLGWYAMAIQLEDYITDIDVPMASVPLQFLTQVYDSSAACDAVPVFIPPTPEEGSCLLPSIGQTTWFLISVQTKDRGTRITDVTTTSTDGMQKSPLRHIPDTRDYYINVTWAPTERREHILCFTATDSAKVSTAQRCIYLAVDPVRPKAISTRLSEDRKTIIINFDQNIYLPYMRHYVWVYNRLLKTLLLLEDTSRSPRVSKVRNMLLIKLPTYVTFVDDVYVILEAGAVRGKTRCSESQPVSDANSLVIKTGVTPTPSTSSTGAPFITPDSGPPSSGTSSQQTIPSTVVSTSPFCCPGTVATGQSNSSRDYTWLIVLVLGTVLLIAAAILVATLIKKGVPQLSKTPPGGAPHMDSGMLQRPVRNIDFSNVNLKYR